MKLRFVFWKLLTASALITSSIYAEEAKPVVEARPEVKTTKDDCDGKPKIAKELDTKTIEQKAVEQKALQNLGLVGAEKPKTDPAIALPATKMETCK